MKSYKKNLFSLSPLVLAVGLVACGGGGGGSSTNPTPATSSAATTSSSSSSVATTSSSSSSVATTSSSSSSTTTSSSSSTATTSVSFTNVSVHDPAIIKVDGQYYVFGSHLASAKTADFMNWSKISDGVNASNPLFNNVTTVLSDAFTWSQVVGLWAPDVVKLADGKYRMYYNSCKGDSPRSALGIAVSNSVTGPYTNDKILLKSGMWGQTSEDGTTIYDAGTQPNVVDPTVFTDKNGKLWMVYGSYSGGIFILELDPTTGYQKPNQGYGKHLIGGYHARIEGAYTFYNPKTNYYYMFMSFGGLAADGAYNMRVVRSANPDGPYYDAANNDMSLVKGNPSVLFDDSKIAPYGQKIMGNYKYTVDAGETGAAIGYVSPGHNSVFYEATTDQWFLIFHTRFPNTGEAHEVRVHELFFNEDGWPVSAPLRYVPLSKSSTTLSSEVKLADVAGTYKFVNHGKDITTTIKNSTAVTLKADGTVSGTVAGTWTYSGTNQIKLDLGATGTFKGVLSRQYNPNASAFTVTFTAQSTSGVSVWGVRSGN